MTDARPDRRDPSGFVVAGRSAGMSDVRRFVAGSVALGLGGLVHAALTWPPRATAAFFAGGGFVAFVAEAAVIERGWLEHHVDPKLLGVPLYILAGWTGIVYVAFRIALLVADGATAVALAAALATGYDALTDHRGVAEGHWTYTDDLPGPRWRDVPWWNFVGWVAISATTAALAVPFL